MLSAVAVTTVSCSDDDKDYPLDVCFTGNTPVIKVVGPGADGSMTTGTPSFNLTFDASGDWNITVRDYDDPSKEANWVKFMYPAGGEGSQRIGVFIDANSQPGDRAAVLSVNCKGKSVSCTLIQQSATPVENPNAAAIDPAKQVAAIYYTDKFAERFSGYKFTYANGVPVKINAIGNEEAGSEDVTYNIAAVSRMTAKGASVNKVDFTSSDRLIGGESFAVLNGKVLEGYDVINVLPDMTNQLISFGYNNRNQLTAIDGCRFNASYTWDSSDLKSMNYSAGSSATVTSSASAVPNNANLDLYWFICYGVDPANQILGAMNLLGVRSANLPATVSAGNVNYSLKYSDGAVDAGGQSVPGMTVSSADGTPLMYVVFSE